MNCNLSFFNLDDPLLEEIKEEILNIDINTLTPVEALMKLNEIKRMLTQKIKAILLTFKPLVF
jgi:DNA mismatch repair protein MutS